MKATILLASGDPSVREAVCDALRSGELRIVHVASGGEVIESLEKAWGDLAVLDLDLPEEDGWRTAEKLLRLRPLVPVVLLTADTETFRLATLAQNGVVLRKPVMAGDLWKTICTRLAETEDNRRWGSGVQLAFVRYMRAYHRLVPASGGRENGEVKVAA